MKNKRSLLLLLSLLIFNGSFQTTIAQKRSSKVKPNQVAEVTVPQPIGIESLSLDQDVVFQKCPFNKYSKSSSAASDSGIVEVSAFTSELNHTGFEYYYLISGGKILGRGSSVIWDLSESKLGEYTITAAIGKNGIISGKTITKKVEIKEFDGCCMTGCFCPTINVEGPTESVKRGDTILFTASVEGGKAEYKGFIWFVSDGEILAGQGTNQILVKTSTETKSKSVTASFEITDDDYCTECRSMVSKTIDFIE